MFKDKNDCNPIKTFVIEIETVTQKEKDRCYGKL